MTNRAILGLASLLVPRAQRREWLAEWQAELWHVRTTQPHQATRFSLGAFADAACLRRDLSWPSLRGAFRGGRPLRCLAALATVAAACFACSLRLRAIHVPQMLLLNLMFLPIGLLVLSAVTPLSLGEYPARQRSRYWAFLAAKLICVLVAVSGGSFVLIALGAAQLLGQVSLTGYVLGLHWVLTDQRRRCPVCLHSLTNPIHFGQPSQTFLAWYGTEWICVNGHGVLHIPEIPSSCYGTQRWQTLDVKPLSES